MKAFILPNLLNICLGCFLSALTISSYSQSIVFSSDSIDKSKTVKSFHVNDKVYLHISTEQPINKTTVTYTPGYIPKTRKCEECGFSVTISAEGSNTTATGGSARYEQIKGKVDFTGNKIVLPLLSTSKACMNCARSFHEFYANLPKGSNSLEVTVHMYQAHYLQPRRKWLKGKITLIKDQKIQLGRTFEADYNAAMSDVGLEQKVVEAMNERIKERKGTRVCKAAKISEKDWTLVRDRYNARVLGRRISCYCYFVNESGSCYVDEYYFWQEFDGVKYSNSVRYYGSKKVTRSEEYIDCSTD